MNAFWNGLSEVEFWSLAEFHLHQDYQARYTGDGYTSRQSINRLFDHQREIAGRVLARLILDGDVVLKHIDTAKRILEPITVLDQIVIDSTFELLLTWVDDFAGRLMTELDEDQQFDQDQEW